MMFLVQKPIVIPADMTLRRAADKLRADAEDISLERCGASALIEMAHRKVADAFEYLAKDCLSTTQLPTSEEARELWSQGGLPRVEIRNTACLVAAPPPRR